MLQREKIYAHIDRNYETHLRKVQELIRQPSISAENRGVRECAELIKRYLQDIIDSIDDIESFTENMILTSSKYCLGYYKDACKSLSRTLIPFSEWDTT